MRPVSGAYSAAQVPGAKTLRRELRETMLHKLVCLPYEDWMDAFLQPQPGDAPIDDNAFQGLFDSVPLTKGETEMYDPFVKAVNEAGILEGFVLAKTYSKADPTDKDGLKADGGMG
ncbi:hypothetical protein NUW54_g6538 [Trametes sanguinea]|uniref:Uncharacterized protein n=1 Tax=Trametes sanguinea TaxID=158606 RepID=A0ACC1PUJ4_9APHY|nr:hypothetical protein NUW54_g6538 [Trametes sanguinea]